MPSPSCFERAFRFTTALPILMAFAATMAVPPAPAKVGFVRSTIVQPVGSSGPRAITLADLNGDRRDDLIAVRSDDDRVAVALNDGNGNFGDISLSAVGRNPIALADGDFNADGFVDLAVVNQADASITVLLGDGSGGLARPPGTGDLAVADSPRNLVVARLDGDAIPDLAILTTTSVIPLRGIGNGAFAPFPEGASIELGHELYAIDSAFLDADPFIDLVVTDPDTGTIVLLAGAGDGTFPAPERLFVGSSPSGLAVADLDNEGPQDIVVTDPDGQFFEEVQVLRGRGNRTFDRPQPVTSEVEPLGIATFDVDTNGEVDLAVTTAAPGSPVTVLCQPSVMCPVRAGEPLDADLFRQPRFHPNLLLPTGQATVVAGRLNGDRYDDLVALGADGFTIGIFLNRSTPSRPCTGDCDRDGATHVNEIITLVNIALGSLPPNRCVAGDASLDDAITVDEIIRSVDRALLGCAVIEPTQGIWRSEPATEGGPSIEFEVLGGEVPVVALREICCTVTSPVFGMSCRSFGLTVPRGTVQDDLFAIPEEGVTGRFTSERSAAGTSDECGETRSWSAFPIFPSTH